MDRVIFVFTTVDSREKAETLAQKLVEERLSACVSISSPVLSFYWWEGKVQREEEYILWIKTLEEKWEEILQFFEKEHPYSVPEVACIPWKDGEKKYIRWMKEYIGG